MIEPYVIAKLVAKVAGENRTDGLAGKTLHEMLNAGPAEIEGRCGRCGRVFVSPSPRSMCAECQEEYGRNIRALSWLFYALAFVIATSALVSLNAEYRRTSAQGLVIGAVVSLVLLALTIGIGRAIQMAGRDPQ